MNVQKTIARYVLYKQRVAYIYTRSFVNHGNIYCTLTRVREISR